MEKVKKQRRKKIGLMREEARKAGCNMYFILLLYYLFIFLNKLKWNILLTKKLLINIRCANKNVKSIQGN